MSVDPSKTSCESLTSTLAASTAEALEMHPSTVKVEIPATECSQLVGRRRLAAITVKY